MRRTLLAILTIALAFTLPSCKKKDPQPSNNAYLMFVHGCAGGATPINVDGRVNNATIANAGNKAFLQNSGYQSVSSGSVNIGFFVSGLSELKSAAENLAAGGHYTAFAGGSVLSPTFVFTTDDMTVPASGNAKIRFVNLSNDTVHMDAFVQSAKIGSSVASQQVTAFTEVFAGTYEIRAGDPANFGSVVTLNNGTTSLGAGKIYTLMLTGTSSATTGTSKLTLTLINNN